MMKAMQRIVGSVVTAVVLSALTACSAGPADPQPSSPEQAVTRYEQFAAGSALANTNFNAAIDALEVRPQDQAAVATFAPACEARRESLDQFARDLEQGRWPASAQRSVDDLVAALDAEVAYHQDCASLNTADSILSWAAKGRSTFGESVVKARQVRAALGKETAP